MFLAQRANGIYFIEFFDQQSKRIKRKSLGTKNQTEAYSLYSKFFQEPIYTDKKESLQNKKRLEEFRKEYVSSLQHTHSQKYISSINLSFKKLIEHCGNIDLNILNTILMQKFINETYGRTKRSAALYFRTLKAAFNKSVDWDYLSENPLRKVKLPRIEKSFPVFITENQLNTILTKVNNEKFVNIYKTAFYTGMRLGEISNLKWKSINLNEKLIVVINDENFTTKSKKERIIPISNKLISIFNNLKQNVNSSDKEDYVFGKYPDVKSSQDHVSRKFKDAVLETGIDSRIHFHTLRHSFASNLVQKGASLYVVKELLGHESITTTQIYAHLQKENLINAVKLLDNI